MVVLFAEEIELKSVIVGQAIVITAEFAAQGKLGRVKFQGVKVTGA